MNTRLSESPQTPGEFHFGLSRREAIRRMALLMGGAFVGAEVLLRGQSLAENKAVPAFTGADRALLDEIGETILPATEIPGAKAVHIGTFMAMMVTDCYDERQHGIFKEGLVRIDQACRARFGSSFLESTPVQRLELANAVEAEQRAYEAAKKPDGPPHYFQMMKDLTVLGYFSSEIGCTQAVRYIEVPGAYHGDVPYKKGEHAWF